MKIRIVAVVFVGVLTVVGGAPAAPVIKDYSSTGGNPVNKTDLKDRMYLVKGGDKITFTVQADGADNYVWQVNKKVQADAAGDSFTWTVPHEKGIWEVRVQAGGAYRELEKETDKVNAKGMEAMQRGIVQHRWGGAHQEWVVSTLGKDEAPEFFEYFADMKAAGRTETDPWGRKLPEWKGNLPDVSEGFAVGMGGRPNMSTESAVAYGTWRWRHKFIDPFFSQVGGHLGFSFIRHKGWTSHYTYGEDMDAHHHCSISDAHGAFSFEYDGAGYWDDGAWQQITIVRTRDGYLQTYRNGILEMHVIDTNPDSSESIYLDFIEPINTRLTGLPPTRGPAIIDNLEIYRDKYLYPPREINYREYVSNMRPEGAYSHIAVKKKGIVLNGRGIRLSDIAAAVGDKFKKTGENVYTCYTNLIVDDGAELIIKDETLKFHCAADGELEFGQNFGSTLRVENSTITSDGDHYFTWNNCAPDTHFAHNLHFANPGVKRSKEGPDSVYRLSACDASGYALFVARNSVIRNTTKMYFDSPYVLNITDTKFEDLRATDTGMYSDGGGLIGYRNAVKGKKSFWVAIDDLNVHDFTLRGITFKGKEPLDITFMTNALRDRLNIYDVDVGEGRIVLRDVPIPNEGQSHSWLGYCHLKGTLKTAWMDGKMGLVNCKFKEIVIAATPGKDCNAYALPKYYLDVRVVNPDGSPVSGASVSAAIENGEIGALASTQNRKYGGYHPPSSIPKGYDLNTVWADPEYSPENMEATRPRASGKYANFYHHYRFISGQKIDSTTTGNDGHTPLPKDTKNTMILTDFVQDKDSKKEFTYTITVEKDGKKKVITGVNPGPEWYRSDPNKPTYTITAVLDGKTVTEAELKK